MRLFVVIGQWDYDSREVIGVFDNRKRAEEVQKEGKRNEIALYDSVDLNERNPYTPIYEDS